MTEKLSVDMMEVWTQAEPNVVLVVQHLKQLRARIWLATKLVAIGCWIGQMDMRLETNQASCQNGA